MSDPEAIARDRGLRIKKLFDQNQIAELASMFLCDAKVMAAGKPIVLGRAAIENHFRKERDKADGGRTEMIEEEVDQLGENTILVRGKYNWFTAENQLFDVGKYIVILKKVDEKWLTYLDICNSDRW